jgi:hypothetical protein
VHLLKLESMSQSRTVDRQERLWVERAGRWGYAAKGLVYILVAYLALDAALGPGSAEDSRGALGSLEDEMFGHAILAVIAAGLLLYALWRAYQAVANPDGDDLRKRAVSAFVCVINLGLAAEAARLAGARFVPSGPESNGNAAQHWSGVLMSKPYGVWLVGIGGLLFAGYGIGRMYHAFKAKLDDQLRLSQLAADRRRWIIHTCRFGIAARGVVFVLIGIFLVQAARHAQPSEAKDFGQSLGEVQKQPFGPILLAIVAAGLLAYGLYELVRARYRAFPTA